MIIQFSAQIDSIHSKKDKTISIKLGTQELEAEATAKIFEHQGHQIWVAFAESGIKEADLEVPEVMDEFDKKSPSKRLRDRMSVYYQWKHGNYEGVEEWRKKQLEKIGQSYLDKMD